MSKKLIAGAGVVASLAVALAPLATYADMVQDASDSHQDKLVLTVLPSCTFGSASKDSSAQGSTYTTQNYPSGITHDNSTGDYGADNTNNEYTATVWDTTETTTGTAGATDSTDTPNHNTNVLDSTGYGILQGEGGVTVGNSRANASSHTVHRSMVAGTSTDKFAQTTMWVVCNNGTGYTITSTATALAGATQNIGVVAASGYSDNTSGYNGIVTVESGNNGMTKDADVVQTAETPIAHKAGVSKEEGDPLTVTYGMGVASSQEADTYVGTVTYKLYKGVNAQNNG